MTIWSLASVNLAGFLSQMYQFVIVDFQIGWVLSGQTLQENCVIWLWVNLSRAAWTLIPNSFTSYPSDQSFNMFNKSIGTKILNVFKKVHLLFCLRVSSIEMDIYLWITGFRSGIRMATTLQITTLMLLSISIFVVSIATPLFDNEQERIFESFLEKMVEEQPQAKKILPVEGKDGQLPKYIANEARESNGKFPLRDSPKKQVGNRRLKCVLYDPKSRKCLRHKMSFLWGRR